MTFKIETGYYVGLLKRETVKLFGSTKDKMTRNENGENVSNMKIAEVVLVHCNIANNNYQRNSRVLHTFILKSFGQLLEI